MMWNKVKSWGLSILLFAILILFIMYVLSRNTVDKLRLQIAGKEMADKLGELGSTIADRIHKITELNAKIKEIRRKKGEKSDMSLSELVDFFKGV